MSTNALLKNKSNQTKNCVYIYIWKVVEGEDVCAKIYVCAGLTES